MASSDAPEVSEGKISNKKWREGNICHFYGLLVPTKDASEQSDKVKILF